jgi:MFS family permease
MRSLLPRTSWLAGLRVLTRALRHRNYRLFFFGQGTSLIGTWMQRVALGWLVYRMTGSQWLLGLVGFSSQILTFVVTPFAGVIADRTNRRYLIIVTQATAMLLAFLLAALTLTGSLAVWHILVLSTCLGLVNSFDIPTRQSFVVEMLEAREDLPNAIALNSFMVNGARLIGPSVAGIMIAAIGGTSSAAEKGAPVHAFGEGVCFLVNGVSFIAVIASLLAMKVKHQERAPKGSPILQNLYEGLAYSLGFEPIRAILLQLALISLLTMPYGVLMPVFAKDILGGGPKALGFLTAAAGVGAIMGAVTLAYRESARGLGKVIAMAAMLLGTALIAFAFSRSIWLSAALLAIVGFGSMIQMASCNTLIQTIVDDDKRGRVMSLYTMAFMGVAPFGSLLAGALAGGLGAPWTVAISGGSSIMAAAIFASRLRRLGRLAHPVYVRKGLVAGSEATGDGLPAEAPSEEMIL